MLIRTPYNKGAENPDLRNPGTYWTQNGACTDDSVYNELCAPMTVVVSCSPCAVVSLTRRDTVALLCAGYCCFIQDVRGRFKSSGTFYKYTGEAVDGYDTVEWLAAQSWCNGCICTTGPSYLCHVQTSMALLRPPHLRAMMCLKGGFYNAHTSGVRNGGAYEARQWVWAIKNAPRKDPIVKACLESVDANFGSWLERYPFKRGDSPLAASPEYENFIFDQASDMEYGPYWKQIGLNTEEYLDDFMVSTECDDEPRWSKRYIDCINACMNSQRRRVLCVCVCVHAFGRTFHASGSAAGSTSTRAAPSTSSSTSSTARPDHTC